MEISSKDIQCLLRDYKKDIMTFLTRDEYQSLLKEGSLYSIIKSILGVITIAAVEIEYARKYYDHPDIRKNN